MGLGKWIRNNWGLWKGSRLYKFFKLKGITHPDNISSIILSSYYRFITKNDIKLKEQVNSARRSLLKKMFLQIIDLHLSLLTSCR